MNKTESKQLSIASAGKIIPKVWKCNGAKFVIKIATWPTLSFAKNALSSRHQIYSLHAFLFLKKYSKVRFIKIARGHVHAMHKYRTVMLTYSDEDIREKKRMNKPEERRYAQCKALDERKARITKRQMRDGCHAKKNRIMKSRICICDISSGHKRKRINLFRSIFISFLQISRMSSL